MEDLSPKETRELDKISGKSGIVGAARKLERVVWLTWWAGTALIVMSWINVVSNGVGWIGFGIACASSLVSVVANRYWRAPR